jgi:hypothetical protein
MDIQSKCRYAFRLNENLLSGLQKNYQIANDDFNSVQKNQYNQSMVLEGNADVGPSPKASSDWKLKIGSFRKYQPVVNTLQNEDLTSGKLSIAEHLENSESKPIKLRPRVNTDTYIAPVPIKSSLLVNETEPHLITFEENSPHSTLKNEPFKKKLLSKIQLPNDHLNDDSPIRSPIMSIRTDSVRDSIFGILRLNSHRFQYK